MAEVSAWWGSLLGLGLDSKELGIVQMGARAAIVYVITVLLVRLGKRRFMGRATAFDVILGIMLGSIVSRAVTGNAPFLPALVATAVLLAMHWVFSGIAMRWPSFGWLIKGRSVRVVRDGSQDTTVLRRSHMTEHDLWEDLRSKGISNLGQVADARLERSGQLSVIKADRPPRIVTVDVAEGVQSIRIELS